MNYLYLSISVIVVALFVSLYGALTYYKTSYREIEKQKLEMEVGLAQTEEALQKQSEAIKRANVILAEYDRKLKESTAKIAQKYKNLNAKNVRTCEDLESFLVKVGEVSNND